LFGNGDGLSGGNHEQMVFLEVGVVLEFRVLLADVDDIQVPQQMLVDVNFLVIPAFERGGGGEWVELLEHFARQTHFAVVGEGHLVAVGLVQPHTADRDVACVQVAHVELELHPVLHVFFGLVLQKPQEQDLVDRVLGLAVSHVAHWTLEMLVRLVPAPETLDVALPAALEAEFFSKGLV